METEAENIEPCLLEVAACKLGFEEVKELATKFGKFKYSIKNDYEKWLNLVKERAFRDGVPLRPELLEMAHGSDEALREGAEREGLGFNSSRLHPDIYMAKLLDATTVIHQGLPAIVTK